MAEGCRFAPTPSGPAHPGTLLAGLLAWLDARSLGAPLLLRIEDIDSSRCTPASTARMREALAWLGLDWDRESLQSLRGEAHAAALDRLAERDLLYPCTCSRSALRAAGRRAADGGWRYPGTCRQRVLPSSGWRAAEGAIRLRLPGGRISLADESGLDLSQDPCEAMGDPVLLRRDGVFAYHLAVVVDDAHDAVTRVVRGRDLAPSTAIHRILQRALGIDAPTWRHHFLLLEEAGDKLAKLHGAVGWEELSRHATGPETCGLLAHLAGLIDEPRPLEPNDLLPDFDWSRVRSKDAIVRWTGSNLVRVTSS